MCKRRHHTAKLLPDSYNFVRDDVSREVRGKLRRIKDRSTDSTPPFRRLLLPRCVFMRCVLRRPGGCVEMAKFCSSRGGLLKTYRPPPGAAAKYPDAAPCADAL